MKRRIFLISLFLLAALILCACGAAEPAPTPEPTPEPTPQPTEYTITDESADEILALAEIDSLKYIDGRGSTEYAALLELYNAMPDCDIVWNYEFEGQIYPSDTTTELKATQLEGLEDAIRYLPLVDYVDVIDTEATVEDLDRYDAIRPGIFFYWSFEHDGFTIRTDIECYSSLRDLNYPRFTSEDMYPMLKYCKNLKALDLGHNDLTDISLIGELKDLEVLILADNPNLVDASPLGNLENLVYMELFMSPSIEDYSFLNNLTKIRDLNLCYCPNLGNLDFLANMPDIGFGMFKYSDIPGEMVEYWSDQYPDAYLTIYDGSIHSCEGGWRDTHRNYLIRYAFASWRHIEDYVHYDDVVYNFNGYVY